MRRVVARLIKKRLWLPIQENVSDYLCGPPVLGSVRWHTVQVSSSPLCPCRLVNFIPSSGRVLGATACVLSWHASQYMPP